MIWQVDPTSPRPIYDQIAESVRWALHEGRLAPGDRLPPAKELAESLDVNMHTVLRGYQVLRDEGLVELRRGSGATVVGRSEARLDALVAQMLAEADRHGLSVDDVLVRIRRYRP